MFGQPEWFKEKTFGWGLTPITWQGWVYTLAFAALAAVPFNVLLVWNRTPEAIVWILACVALLVWDVKQIIHALRQKSPPVGPAKPAKETFYIGDDGKA